MLALSAESRCIRGIASRVGLCTTGAATAVSAGVLLAAPASATPIEVFQQPTEVLGGQLNDGSTSTMVPVREEFRVATEQVAPGTVRMWIVDNQRPCRTPVDALDVAWGNVTTGAMGVARLAPCAGAPAPHDAVVTTGAGQVNFQKTVAGPSHADLGSSGSVGDPGAPFLTGNGAFTVA